MFTNAGINYLCTSALADVYYDRRLMRVYDDHRVYLSEQGGWKPLNVTPNMAAKYRFDFFGLLAAYKVSEVLFWPTLRVNGLHSSTSYEGIDTAIIIPSDEEVERIRHSFQTQTKKIL